MYGILCTESPPPKKKTNAQEWTFQIPHFPPTMGRGKKQILDPKCRDWIIFVFVKIIKFMELQIFPKIMKYTDLYSFPEIRIHA